MSGSVLLVESEHSVIKDVSCSLRLVDIPLVEAGSIAEAKEQIQRQRPRLVLARAGLQDDPQAGIHMAQALADEQDLSGIPICLLATASERSRLDEMMDLFDAEFALPVEFPAITYKIKGLLEEFAGGKTARRVAGAETLVGEADAGREIETGTDPQVVQILAELSEQEGVAVVAPTDNLLIAYELQLAVMDALRGSPFFSSIKSNKVPEVLVAVTQAVCRSYRVGKPEKA